MIITSHKVIINGKIAHGVYDIPHNSEVIFRYVFKKGILINVSKKLW